MEATNESYRSGDADRSRSDAGKLEVRFRRFPGTRADALVLSSDPGQSDDHPIIVYPGVVALELAGWSLTGISVLGAAHFAGLLGLWPVLSAFALLILLGVAASLTGLPGQVRAASFADGLPVFTFLFASWMYGIAYVGAHKDSRRGPGYAELEPFFSAAAQVTVGLLIVIAVEGRSAARENYRDRVMFRQGLLQTGVAAGAALSALSRSDDGHVQVFAAILVVAGLGAAFVSVLFLSVSRVARNAGGAG